MKQEVGHFAPTHAQQAIGDCLAAYRSCLETAGYYVNQTEELNPQFLQVLYDCADANLMLANFLTRASRFHRELAALCLQISERCAEAVAGLDGDDPQLRATYAACQRSRQACAELTGQEEPPRADRHDEALRETFPGSDTTPPPTEL